MKRALLVILLIELFGCAHKQPQLGPQPAWVGDCIDISEQRVATALAGVSLSNDGALLIRQLLSNLPDRDKAAIAASLSSARSMLGHNPTFNDLSRLRDKVAWRAFFVGFDRSPTCDVRDGYVTVDFFTSSVLGYLNKRDIDVSAAFAGIGSPPSEHNTDHEELKVWLLMGAAGAL
ncbi:MAG: hypothetical protein EOP50_02435 [Sphingobacteriales bacterium]|nr:MAG: hypothetical protein EOP50_02435 [Sphingobacteriales bacterium]